MIFPIAEPQTLEQTRRQANCYYRALAMEEQGYTVDVVTELQSGECYLVTNPEGTTYTVDPLTGKCNCPDFVKHQDFCKHMLFVNQWEEKQTILRDEATAAYYEELIANGYP